MLIRTIIRIYSNQKDFSSSWSASSVLSSSSLYKTECVAFILIFIQTNIWIYLNNFCLQTNNQIYLYQQRYEYDTSDCLYEKLFNYVFFSNCHTLTQKSIWSWGSEGPLAKRYSEKWYSGDMIFRKVIFRPQEASSVPLLPDQESPLFGRINIMIGGCHQDYHHHGFYHCFLLWSSKQLSSIVGDKIAKPI